MYFCQVKKMFEKADKNGDGKLTKTEWLDVLRQSGVQVTKSVSYYN